MNSLSNASRLVATDLRRAERSINMATRDTAQVLLTKLEITETQKLSPAVAHRTVKTTVDALTALVDGQHHMAMRAHITAEKAGSHLGLTVTSWGEGYPKPNAAEEALDDAARISEAVDTSSPVSVSASGSAIERRIRRQTYRR